MNMVDYCFKVLKDK